MKHAFLFIISLALMSRLSMATENSPSDIAEVLPKDVVVSNCGLNCLLCCQRLLLGDHGSLSPVLLKTLGEQCEKPLSFRDLADEFKRNNLEAVAIESVGAEQILRTLTPAMIAVVRLQTLDMAHFVCVFREGDHYKIFDYPYKEITGDIETVSTQLKKKITGEVLFVYQNSSKSQGNLLPAQSIDSLLTSNENNQFEVKSPNSSLVQGAGTTSTKASAILRGNEISLPSTAHITNISQYKDVITAELVVKNEGSQSVQIMEAHGSCSCFLGMLGSGEITPKDSRRLSFKFSRDKFDVVHGTEVMIHTTDAALPLAKISFAAIANNVPELIVLPKEVDLGKIGIMRLNQPISFMIAIDSNYSNCISMLAADVNEQVSTKIEPLRTFQIGGRTFSYATVVCFLKDIPHERFTRIVQLKTSHPVDNEINLKIVATPTEGDN